MVHNEGATVTFHQCRFDAKRDGYCAIHHPDAAEARRVKAEKAYEERRAKDPFNLMRKRIEELESENAKLLAEIIDLRNGNGA
jgi:hypothetical protein